MHYKEEASEDAAKRSSQIYSGKIIRVKYILISDNLHPRLLQSANSNGKKEPASFENSKPVIIRKVSITSAKQNLPAVTCRLKINGVVVAN